MSKFKPFSFLYFSSINLKQSLFVFNRSNCNGIQDDVVFYSPEDASISAHELCQHQPVLGFKHKEPFLYDSTDFGFHSAARGQSRLPDIVTQATLECFYGN